MMLSTVTIILLSLNLIGIAYLVFKDMLHTKSENPNLNDQTLFDKQHKLKREIGELKESLHYLKDWLEHDYRKMKTELQSKSTVIQESKPESKQQLFLNDRFKEVFDLYEKGLSADEIAKKLGKGSGEIAFILQLANQDKS